MTVTTEIDLSSNNLIRPFRINWIYKYNGTDLLSGVKSKSTKKFLENSAKVLENNHISYRIEELQFNKYKKWLEYYQQKMTENNYDILANVNWYDKKITDKCSLFILELLRDDLVIGTGIIYRSTDNSWTLSFKASEKITIAADSGSSLGTIIDYLFIKYAHDHHASQISSGKSRNAFNFYNSFGNLQFKTKMGYRAIVAQNTELLAVVPVVVSDPVGFFAFNRKVASNSADDASLNFFLLSKSGVDLKPKIIESLKYIDYQQLSYK